MYQKVFCFRKIRNEENNAKQRLITDKSKQTPLEISNIVTVLVVVP